MSVMNEREGRRCCAVLDKSVFVFAEEPLVSRHGSGALCSASDGRLQLQLGGAAYPPLLRELSRSALLFSGAFDHRSAALRLLRGRRLDDACQGRHVHRTLPMQAQMLGETASLAQHLAPPQT